jgi:hypothetical protein
MASTFFQGQSMTQFENGGLSFSTLNLTTRQVLAQCFPARSVADIISRSFLPETPLKQSGVERVSNEEEFNIQIIPNQQET